MPPALHVAYGPRGVAKLVSLLSEPTDLATNISTLNSLLSNQESKMEALKDDGAVVPVLTGLLASTDAKVREQAALAIASLTLVYQGRLAASDAETVAALAGPLREDSDADVREACAKALESLTSSRDGCSVVYACEGIVTKLTTALDDSHTPVHAPTIGALANMVRLDLGVMEALDAGAIAKVAALVTPAQRDAKTLETSLQCLWNLANSPTGKIAAIEAGLLETLAAQMDARQSPSVRRLAAGCVMAITVEKDGKLNSLNCVEPLLTMLFDPACDNNAVRSVVGALKNK